MNLNFTFGYFSRRTLRAVIHGIAPMDLGVKHLDFYVLTQIEQQIRYFPFWHRFGFILGLQFLEWGALLGGWGFMPLSLLTRQQVTLRLEGMIHSRWPPIRLLIQGLKILICLSAYGHKQVELKIGFNRRSWRDQRIRVQHTLLSHSQNRMQDSKTDSTHTGWPTPTALVESHILSEDHYLHDEALSLLHANIKKNMVENI
jgi:hypothetical protein